MIFLAQPLAVLILGVLTLVDRWRRDNMMRADLMSAIQGIRRNALIGMITTATCLAAGIFAAVVIHIVTD